MGVMGGNVEEALQEDSLQEGIIAGELTSINPTAGNMNPTVCMLCGFYAEFTG